MSKILFTHSYFLRFDPKQWRLGQPYPPLGTLYAAAFMRTLHEVRVHDIQFSEGSEVIGDTIKGFRPDYLVIYDDGFNYLTKMCLTNMREAAFRMIRIAKEEGITVMVSGSDSTDHFEEYLRQGADYILLGEAEQTLSELINSLERNTGLLDIPGIAYHDRGAVVRTRKRPVMTELDRLPIPAWDLIDLRPYQKMWRRNAGYFSINIGTTRGCPFKCNWCAKPIYGNRYNARSPRNVINEIQYLQRLTGFDHVWFCDDIFGLKPGWVDEFAKLVENENLKFRFKIQSRADLLVQENYVQALKRAGCETVWMGAESGSQKILDAMDKGTTIEQISTATRLLRQHGIQPAFFIQFGYLGETKEDINLTIDMINKLVPHEIGISVSYPLPGTGFYEKVKAELKQKSNWSDSDDLALMFHNTFQPPFYRQLHRYVHTNYRKNKAMEQWRSLIRKPWGMNWKDLRTALSGLYLLPSSYLSRRRLQKLESLV